MASRSTTAHADPTISDLEIMSSAPAYRRWMFDTVKQHLGRRILEVGAGIGNFTEFLLDRELVVAVDILEPCVQYAAKRFAGLAHVIPMQFDIQEPRVLELKGKNFDTAVCLNVLEHIEDDVQALRNIGRLLRPAGRLVLLVPACRCLYGTVDQALGHFRRYSSQELTAKLHEAGFEIEQSRYMNLLGVFGWFYNNRIIHREEESLRQVLFFDRAIVPWLSRIEKRVQPPFGLSLVTICRKPHGA
jgi:SAM-dependent methyltransferase